MTHTEQWCSVGYLDTTINLKQKSRSGREWYNTHLSLFSDQTAAFIEEVATQTELELFNMPRQLFLSHVTSSYSPRILQM